MAAANTPSIEEMNKIALKHLEYGFQIVEITSKHIILRKNNEDYTYANGTLIGPSGDLPHNRISELYGPKLIDDAKALIKKHADEYAIVPDSEIVLNGYYNGTNRGFRCDTIVGGVSVSLYAKVFTDTVCACPHGPNPYRMENKNIAARELVKFAKRFEAIERRLAESEAQKAIIEAKLADSEARLKKEIDELCAAIGKN